MYAKQKCINYNLPGRPQVKLIWSVFFRPVIANSDCCACCPASPAATQPPNYPHERTYTHAHPLGGLSPPLSLSRVVNEFRLDADEDVGCRMKDAGRMMSLLLCDNNRVECQEYTAYTSVCAGYICLS